MTQSIPLVLWAPYTDPAFVAGIRAFVRDAILPVADAIDADDVYPVEIVRQLGRAGYNTNALPAVYGGAGRSYATRWRCSKRSVCQRCGRALLTIFKRRR